jgi:hypothetical protein
MEKDMKLFYIILGATPKGEILSSTMFFRNCGKSERSGSGYERVLERSRKIHLDCYQEVKFADGYEVKIVEKVKEILKNSCILLTWRI